MTVEHRVIVGLNDIKAVVFECRKCHARISVLAEDAKVPHCCPCGQQWTPDYIGSVNAPKLPAYQRFCSVLRECRTLQANGAAFMVLLEFEAPEFEDSIALEKASKTRQKDISDSRP